MADRKTVGSVDAAARAKFQEELRKAGRPQVRRTATATPTTMPTTGGPFMSVMQVIRASLDDLAAKLLGRRSSDMSGIGGRRREGVVMDQAAAAETGVDEFGRPLKQ